MIEHMAAGEEKNGDEADGGPDIAVLDYGEDVRGSCDGKRDDTHDGGDANNPANPVDGPRDVGMRAVGSLTNQPGMNLLSALGPAK